MVVSRCCPSPVRHRAARPSMIAVATPLPEIGSGDWSPIGMLPSPDWNTEFPANAPMVGLNAARLAYGPAVPYEAACRYTMSGLIWLTVCVVDAEPFRRARPEVVQEGVGLGDQPVQDLLPGRGLQVDSDGFLALHRPDHVLVGDHPPERVAGRRFDLDDPGAQIGEQGAAERSGQPGRQSPGSQLPRAGAWAASRPDETARVPARGGRSTSSVC